MLDLEHWTPRPPPTNAPAHGRTVSLVPFDADKHGALLWAALGGDAGANEHIRYFGWPVLASAADFVEHLQGCIAAGQWASCVFVPNATGRPAGMASYMRTDTQHGSTEVGCVAHGTGLAGTAAATEAHYLMARRVFEELGYRRYEWKLNDRNAASHRAALRFGFTFEGVFRQHRVARSENRDTAWYSLLDREWPTAGGAMRAWLDPSNFDINGQQRRRLQDLRAAAAENNSGLEPPAG
jgi:RimJ/RimL family protein N-acetyltransferase